MIYTLEQSINVALKIGSLSCRIGKHEREREMEGGGLLRVCVMASHLFDVMDTLTHTHKYTRVKKKK